MNALERDVAACLARTGVLMMSAVDLRQRLADLRMVSSVVKFDGIHAELRCGHVVVEPHPYLGQPVYCAACADEQHHIRG